MICSKESSIPDIAKLKDLDPNMFVLPADLCTAIDNFQEGKEFTYSKKSDPKDSTLNVLMGIRYIDQCFLNRV